MAIYVSPELSKRVKAAVQRADEAFWAEIAESFPEARTGDLSPQETVTREVYDYRDVVGWLRWNTELVIEL